MNKRLLTCLCLMAPPFIIPSSASAKKIKCEAITIPIYSNEQTERSFVVIGKIHISGYDQSAILCTLKKKALEYDGDAVIQFQTYTRSAPPGSPVLMGLFIVGQKDSQDASGIIVRWSKEGEIGINKLTAGVPIPVLR